MKNKHRVHQSKPPHWPAIEKLAVVDRVKFEKSTIAEVAHANNLSETSVKRWIRRARHGEAIGLMAWFKNPEVDRLRRDLSRCRLMLAVYREELRRLLSCPCKPHSYIESDQSSSGKRVSIE